MFVIRSEEIMEPPRALELAGGDQAAFDYASDLVRRLKKDDGYDDPGLVVTGNVPASVARSRVGEQVG
jgi:hypothetical protein